MLKKMKNGSMTVETACVMPLLLLVIFGTLYLCFFVHNRSWLTAAAYEAAVSGSMEGVKKDGKIYETARMRSLELGDTGFFGGENINTQTNVGKKYRLHMIWIRPCHMEGFSGTCRWKEHRKLSVR